MSWSVRSDVELNLAFLRHGGAARATMIATCTTLVSALLLVAVTVLLLGGGSEHPEQLANVAAVPGVRAGYVFALVLICIAPLALLRQVLRLGTAEREQRLAGLRLAGASPADVHRLAAGEVGLPALLGGVLGYPAFLALRAVFGGRLHSDVTPASAPPYDLVRRELSLVPVSVEPSWWLVALVVVLVGAAGAGAGVSAARGVTVSPLGVSRRAPRRAPRPWGIAIMLLAVPAFALSYRTYGAVFGIAFVALLIIGMLVLTPWVAYRVATTVAARASSPHVLLAACRLAADPRPAGRAAAAIGAIGMVAGGGGALISGLPDSYSGAGGGYRVVEPMYTVPIMLVGGILLVALVLVVVALAVHGAETLMDRKHAIAALVAAGTTHEELQRAQRWEIGLVALPVAIIGVLVGSVPYVIAVGAGTYLWVPILVDVATIAMAGSAVLISAWITSPWLRRAATPTNLRTG